MEYRVSGTSKWNADTSLCSVYDVDVGVVLFVTSKVAHNPFLASLTCSLRVLQVDAGDDVHVGFYQSIREGDSFEGIRWKDGNRWIKKDE